MPRDNVQEQLDNLQEVIRRAEDMPVGFTCRPFWNWIECPHADYCTHRTTREKTLVKHRCLYNPSIFRCEAYIMYEKLLMNHCSKISLKNSA